MFGIVEDTLSEPDLADPNAPDTDGKDSPFSTASSSSVRSVKNDDKYSHITDTSQLEDLVRFALHTFRILSVKFKYPVSYTLFEMWNLSLYLGYFTFSEPELNWKIYVHYIFIFHIIKC